MSPPGKGAESPGEAEWRSYRCPVCGHVDEVAVSEGGVLRIRCSHCEASLEVEGKRAGSGTVSVHVAPDEPPDA